MQAVWGYLGEQAPLYRDMSVRGFLFFIAELKKLDKNNRQQAVMDVTRAVDVQDRFQDKIDSLSKGLKQRVALAGALLGGAELLLLDEPSSGLDPLQSEAMQRMILQQKQANKTVIFSSHIVDEVQRLSECGATNGWREDA